MLDGPKIKRLREANGLSQRGLCRLATGKISCSHLSEIENGKVGNPTKRITRALAQALHVKEVELFSFEDYVEGEFTMCKYRREYPTLNGWVYYCDLTANGMKLTAEQLAAAGCTEEKRMHCKQMMEYTCGVGIVPEVKK